MTDMTDEAVKSLLEGATPGPWRADGEPWNRIVWSSADNRVCFMAHSSGLNDARDIATSNLIAAAPDLARALLDARAELAEGAEAAEAELATLRAQVERLTGALTIAANRLHRCSVDYDTGTREFIEVGGWADEARAALTEGAAP